MRRLLVLFSGICLIAPLALRSQPRLSPSVWNQQFKNCDETKQGFCTDRSDNVNYEGDYIGHDEPSLIFYSGKKGSGSSSFYTVTLPKEPPTAPKQDGTGGVFNFQLHPALWFGMALCDTQSAPSPNPNSACTPGSDSNIFDNPNPVATDYIGKHPGTAFLELQFYPPGWIGSPELVSTGWFAALNIDSASANLNTGQLNNPACLAEVGQEPVNFAVITLNGVPLFPSNPLGVPFGNSNLDLGNVLNMNGGDVLQVGIFDTPAGLEITIVDLTTGQSGSMIAGPAAGFGQVNFQPSATTCSVTPYAFHPMYDTSSEHTRVPWAAHTYNIAFSDEIGHFEYCNAFGEDPTKSTFFQCTTPGVNDPTVDADDFPCANPAFLGLPAPPFVPITGCIGEDLDFDGTPYRLSWPGANPATDASLHPDPFRFTSAQFQGPGNSGLRDYDRVAFEVDLPLNEIGCNRITGAGCVNPPPGAQFYPVYSTAIVNGQCVWQLGGTHIPGTVNTFGGNSSAQFGPLLFVAYPGVGGPVIKADNFRRILDSNPCPAGK